MSEIKKDPIREALDAAAQKTAIKNQTILEDPFKKGGRIISAKQLDVDRFATYDSKTYGKLGFDPFKDNNKVYNEKTHWSKDVGRAWDGMWKLAGVGFQDTFAFGLTAGSDSSKNFEDVMKNYSSTRGGYTQFWSNTMLSSGYTVGIGLAIAAEEIGLALTTGGLGNIGTSGLVGMQATRAFNKLNRITRSVSHIDEAARLGNIDEAVKFFSMKGLGQNLGKLGQKLNPIGETADFLRKSKLDEFSQFNDLQKVSLGAGAIARDARKLYMTHSESRLEADLAKSDFINKEIQKARLKSPTGELDQDSINQIRTDASNVYNSTYMGNLGLIYATNAITIDNMFKSMRYSNKMFSIPGKFTTALGKDGLVVKAVKGFSGKRALAAGRKAIADFSVKESAKDLTRYIGKNYKVAGANLVKKGLSNSMEGIQELGQDIVSNSVQSYYGRNHAGQQVRGGFLENMWQAASQFSAEDVGASIKGAVLTKDKDGNTVLNQEGLTTFGSGFFMGSIASPFGSSIGYLQKQIVGGGAKAKIQYIFDRENYVKKQKSEYKKSLAKAKQLTATFNAQLGSFLEYTSNPLVTQSEFQEQILDAAQKGDKKRFEDKKHDSFQQGLKHMLKNNSEGMFTDFLEHMVDKFTPEQMNQAMGRNDITADNVAEYKAKLQTKVATVKSLRAKYDQINEQVVPPIRQSDIDRLDESDPEQRKQKLDLIIYKKAWENLKDELLFNNGKITNKAQRLIELERQLNKESGLSSTEVQAFISKDGLSKEIQILQTQVEANKNLNLKGEEAKKAKEAEFKLEALQNYQKALTAVEEAESAEEPSIDKIEDAYSDLFEAYHDYRSVDAEYGMFYGKEEAEEVKRAISRKSFDAIVDYLDLKTESQALQDIVNTLVDPTSATMWVERNAEMMADLDKNKEKHIANQLYAFQEKAASSEMLTELQEAGIFFDLNELDDLVSKGIMPSKIYNIESNKESSKEEYQKAQDIISGFYKKLTGKTITQDKSRVSKRSLRFKEDKRTVKGLLRQYGIKLGKEIDLSDPVQLERLLRKLKGSEFLTYIDKELLDKVSDSAPRIMFVDNAEFPISVNEDGVFVIDVRYAGSDYKNVAVNFETLVLSALTQAKLNDSLAENEDLQAEVENLMQQAKDAFAKKYPNLDVDKISLFNSTAEFLSESLNNTAYQAFLGEITDTVSGKKESLWKSLMAKIMKAFNKTFEGSVLQRAVSLANMALDESITDNINEKADETVTEEEEQLEPVSSVEKNGVKLMEAVPGVWQVTDKDGNINAFDTKEEAEEYFNEQTKTEEETQVEIPTQEQELIDAETKLKTEINQKRELLKRVNEQIASSKKIQLRKRMKLDKQKTQLLLDLKDLQEEYDAKFGSEAVLVSTATGVTETLVEEEVNLDNTLVITERTPFDSLPGELQDRLVEQYRLLVAANSVGAIRSKYKAEIRQLEALNRAMAQAPEEEVDALDEQFGETFDALVASIGPGFTVRLNEQNKIEISTIKSNAEPSEAEIEAIQKSMAADMSFMKTIIEYNKEQEPEEFVPAPVTQTTVELTDEELAAYNAAEIERGKQLKQQRLDQQKEEARARSRARKQSIVPINAMEREQVSELLKKVLKEDFDILTMADLTYLIDNLLNDSKTFRFKIPDVIAFVNKKKIKLEQDSQIATVNETFADELEGLEPKARAEAVLGYQKDIFDAIAENSTAYNYGILSKYVKSKEPIKVSYNGKSYSFTLRPIELKALALYNKDLFGRSLKTKEDETQFLINIHQVLENVKKQAAYYKKNLKFTGTPQEIEDQAIELFFELKKKGILLPSVVNAVNYAFYNSKTKLTISRSNALSGSIYTLEEREGVAKRKQPKNKLAQDKTTVREFIYESGFMVTSPLFQEALVADWFSNPENRVHPDFITKNIARGKSEIAFYKSFISNKSKYKTADGVGDAAAGDFANEIQDADVYMQEAVNEIFANYKSISQMFAAIAEKIREFQKEEDYGQYESEAEFENWIGTQEAEKAASDFDEYIMSLEFKITTGQLDLATTDYASLTPAQQLLFDQAVEDGLYEVSDSKIDAKKADIVFSEKEELEIAKFKKDTNTEQVEFSEIFKNEKDKTTLMLWEALKPYIRNGAKIYYQDGYYFAGGSELAAKYGYSATIDGKGNVLIFNKTKLNSDTILHELLHDFLLDAVNINKDEVLITELQRIFDKVKEDADLVERYSYAFSNLDEFVSEVFGNKGFRQELSYIKDFKLNKTSSIFDSVSNAIKNFLNKQFGFKINNTVLDNIFNAVEHTIKGKNKEINAKYNTELTDGFSEYLNEIQEKQTAVDKIEADLLEELRRMGDSYPFVPFLIKQIEALENDKNLNLFLAAYRITNAEMFNQFTLPQKNFLNDRLMQRLDMGAFIGQSVLIDESPMQIFSYNMADKTVDLVDIATGEVQTLPIEELFKSTDVFEEGQEYTKLNLDTVVNDQEIVYIKEAYRDIFNNFTASVAEFDKLENADLNSQVLEQLTKCK
jgi:hypothetical protein